MPIAAPFTVVVRLSQGENLGETMNRLRSWLDREKIQIAEFKTEADATGYTFKIGFLTVDAANRFRRQFASKDRSDRAA